MKENVIRSLGQTNHDGTQEWSDIMDGDQWKEWTNDLKKSVAAWHEELVALGLTEARST